MQLIYLIEKVGRRSVFIIEKTGNSVIFLFSVISFLFRSKFKIRLFIKQIYDIGFGSILIVMLTGLFTGMVLALQGFYTLQKFGSESLLGPAVALSLIRELGPVLTALVVTGRAGSAMAAEIGIMVITEQVDALKSMAVEPLKQLILPRILSGILVFPLLTAMFNLLGIFGGYLVGVKLLGLNSGVYFGEMSSKVEMSDLIGGFWKSLAFGLFVVWICTYKGYHCGHGAEGVSKATTSAVVFISDYFLTSIFFR